MTGHGTKGIGNMAVLMAMVLFSSQMESQNMKVSGIKGRSTGKEQKPTQTVQSTLELGTMESKQTIKQI